MDYGSSGHDRSGGEPAARDSRHHGICALSQRLFPDAEGIEGRHRGRHRRPRTRRHHQRRPAISFQTAYQQAVQAVLATLPAAGLEAEVKASSPMTLTSAAARTPLISCGHARLSRRHADRLWRQVAHQSDIGGLVPGSSARRRAKSFTTACWCRRCGSRAMRASRRRSRRSSPTTAASARSCSAICARRSGDPGSESKRFAALVRRIRPRHRARGDGEPHAPRRTSAIRGEIALWPDGDSEAEDWWITTAPKRKSPYASMSARQKTRRPAAARFLGLVAADLGADQSRHLDRKAVSLLALLATADPTISVNHGLTDAVKFIIPPGLVVSPRHPATVNHYFPSAHLGYSVVLAALGKLNPARAVAPSGLGSGAVSIGYRVSRTGKPAGFTSC